MMLSSASRQIRHVGRRATFVRRGFVTSGNRAAAGSSSAYWMAAASVITMAAASTLSIERTSLDAPASLPGPVEEAKTGILFPPMEGNFSFVGCGVRVKYGFVKVGLSCMAVPKRIGWPERSNHSLFHLFCKVYAVGTYADAMDMAKLKPLARADRIKALLDPAVPRTIRIVMNRNLSIEKYTSAIVEALEPRMKGQDAQAWVRTRCILCLAVFAPLVYQPFPCLLWTDTILSLESFRQMSVTPPVDLKEGDEIKMTVIGDMLHYRTAGGGGGTIQSHALTVAMCDVYYGADPVSPTHLEAVLEGINKM